MSTQAPRENNRQEAGSSNDSAAESGDAKAFEKVILLTMPRRRPDGAIVADTSTLLERWQRHATNALTQGQVDQKITAIKRAERLSLWIFSGIITLLVGAIYVSGLYSNMMPAIFAIIVLLVAFVMMYRLRWLKILRIKVREDALRPYLTAVRHLREAFELVQRTVDIERMMADALWAQSNTFGQLVDQIDKSLTCMLGSQMLEYGIFALPADDCRSWVSKGIGHRMEMLTVALSPFGGSLCDKDAYIEAAREAFKKSNDVEF